MYASLIVVEYCCRREWKHRLVPHPGIDVDAEGAVAVEREEAVAVEREEVLRPHVVAGFGEQRHELRTIARPNRLTACWSSPRRSITKLSSTMPPSMPVPETIGRQPVAATSLS